MIENAELLEIAERFDVAGEEGVPVIVNDKDEFAKTADEIMQIEMPFGMTARYALKANSNLELLRIAAEKGLSYDASSWYEAVKLIDLGVNPGKIAVSSQVMTGPHKRALEAGVLTAPSSLTQLEKVAEYRSGEKIGLGINPGEKAADLGGYENKTSVAGPNSSFRIYHTYLQKALEKAAKHGMTVNRLHIHVGSGVGAINNPRVWQDVMEMGLELAEQMDDVEILDIGGGFKVARMPDEDATDLKRVMQEHAQALEDFGKRTGRKLKLEIEPGTYMAAKSGIMLAKIDDITQNGPDGYKFLRITAGMNQFLRQVLYGAQHPMEILNDSQQQEEYVVVGPTCESTDVWTIEPGKPGVIKPYKFNKASLNDIMKIGWVGAYGASMLRNEELDGSYSSYNSFPFATQVTI